MKPLKEYDKVFQKAREQYAEALTADIVQGAEAKMREWNARGGMPRLLKLKNRVRRGLHLSH